MHSSKAFAIDINRICVCVCESPAQSPDAGFNFCSVTQQRAGRRGESGCDCQKLALVPQLLCTFDLCVCVCGCTQVRIVCHVQMSVAVRKLRMCIQSCSHVHRGTARERKNSSHLHCVYSVAAVATNCQVERGEREEMGVGGSRLTRCEIITSAYGCGKPSIRGCLCIQNHI